MRASAVLASFHLSYGGLPDPAKRMFRLLGLVPGPDISAETAAALADTSLAEASHLLDLLVSAHLLEEQTYRRYAFHDLLRRYAESRAGTDEPDRAGAARRTGCTTAICLLWTPPGGCCIRRRRA